MKKEQELEFEKIKDAFEKVKADINDLSKELITLRVGRNKDAKRIKDLEELVLSKANKNYSIVGNESSRKVHYSNCPYAKKISSTHFTQFESVKEALKEGYNRCSCIFNN